MIWTATDLINATGGQLLNGNDASGALDWAVSGMALDNRKTKTGDLFIAIKGEHHDGHDYAAASVEAGAVAALVSTPVAINTPQILVADTLAALEQLATEARRRSQAQIIAITGSVGKTGTKHIMASCLAALGLTHASEGNYNNHIGAPLSLALMPQPSAYGVFELGMNHSGEIAALSPMVAPHIAVITRISNSHGGFFDSLDDIAAAKAEIFTGLMDGGIAVLNADDPYAGYLSDQARCHGASRVITCGFAETAAARLMQVTRHDHGLAISATINGQAIDFSIKMNAPHWALSAVMALAVVDALHPNDNAALKAAAQAMAGLEDLAGRGKRHTATLENGHQIKVIDDSYNASPASMASALIALGQDPEHGRRVAVLADMLELGDEADPLHRGLITALTEASPALLICFGASMAHLAKAYHDTNPDAIIHHCRDAHDAVAAALPLLQDGDLVLVKGSNGMKTSHVVSALRAASTEASTGASTEQNTIQGGHHAA